MRCPFLCRHSIKFFCKERRILIKTQQSKVNIFSKNTLLFLVSQTVSLFGSMLVQYAITWHITLTTQSGAMMTLSILCGFLPTLLISPFAGVWADRHSRKMLIALADSFIALATLITAIVFLTGHGSTPLLLFAAALRALGTGVQNPAVGALLPDLVPPEGLMKVNAVNTSIMSAVMLISPMVSGALLSVMPLETVFFVDVVTAALAVTILTFFVKSPRRQYTPEAAPEEAPAGYFGDFKKGLSYVACHPYLRRFFLYCAGFTFLIAPCAFLSPLQVTRNFGAEVWRLTAIEIAFSGGMMAGGALIAGWGGFRNRIHTMILAGVVVGVGNAVLGLMPNFIPYLFVMAVLGASTPFFNTPATVLLQEKVEPEYLGRVFGVLTMITSSMMPLGMLFFGPLADSVSLNWIFVLVGTLLFLMAVLMLRSRSFVSAGEPAAKQPSPEGAD